MTKRGLDTFLSLPVNSDETWQGGIIPMADVLGIPPAEDADETAMVLWRSTSSELVHAKPISLAGEGRLNGFVEVMLELNTALEFPVRPVQIECNDPELTDGLNDLLRDSGTTAVLVPEMTEWNAVLQDMTEHFGLAGPPIPSLMDVGCTEQQIREFADAAAAFYRAKLWDYLDDIDLIKIETPKPPRHLKNAVVLGAASETHGLGFYDKRHSPSSQRH